MLRPLRGSPRGRGAGPPPAGEYLIDEPRRLCAHFSAFGGGVVVPPEEVENSVRKQGEGLDEQIVPSRTCLSGCGFHAHDDIAEKCIVFSGELALSHCEGKHVCWF